MQTFWLRKHHTYYLLVKFNSSLWKDVFKETHVRSHNTTDRYSQYCKTLQRYKSLLNNVRNTQALMKPKELLAPAIVDLY